MIRNLHKAAFVLLVTSLSTTCAFVGPSQRRRSMTSPLGMASTLTDEDLDIIDSAETTPQFLSGLWQLIARGNSMVKGVSESILTTKGDMSIMYSF